MASKSATVRDWPMEEYFSLTNLLDRLSKRQGIENALLQYMPDRAEAHFRNEDVSAEWVELEQHPLWVKLKRDRALMALREAFDTNQKRAKRVSYPRDHFALMSLAVLGAALYAIPRSWPLQRGPAVASAELRESAVQAIKRLRRYRRKGIGLEDKTEDFKFWNLLDQLEQQLSSADRKVHVHSKFRETDCVRWFTENMLSRFGDTSGTVL